MSIDYGNVITRSWNIAWQHRVLWMFGFIIALLSGSSNVRFNNLNTPSGSLNSSVPLTSDQFLAHYGVLLLGGVLLFIVVAVALSFVRALAEAALITAADQIERGTTRLTFGGVWRMGRPHMLRMWLLQFLPGLVVFVLVLLTLLPIIAAIVAAVRADNPEAIFSAASGSFAIFCLAVPVVALIATALWLVQRHAMRALVLRDEGVFQSLRSGWRTLRQHFGPTLLMLLIQSGLSFAFLAALLLVGFLVFSMLLLVSAANVSAGAPTVLIAALTLLLGLLSAAVLAMPTVFFSALWTVLWRQLHTSAAPTYVMPTSVQPYQP